MLLLQSLSCQNELDFLFNRILAVLEVAICYCFQVISLLWLPPAASCTVPLHVPVATTLWTAVGKALLISQPIFQKPLRKCM